MDDAAINRRARLWFAASLALVFAAGAAWMLRAAASHATYVVETRDPVSGLIADAPVELHGVEVGRVKRVELTAPDAVRITLEVDREAPIDASTVATITARGLAMRGFTGYVYVALENVGGDARPLVAAAGAAPVIRAAPAQVVNMDLAIAQLDRNVQGLTGRVDELLDPATLGALKRTVAGLERVTGTMVRNEARVESLLASAERASRDAAPFMQSARGTLARLDALLEPRTVASLQKIASSLERVGGMLAANEAKLDALIGRGESASRELEPLLQSTRETLRLLQGQVLPEAHRTLANVDELTSTLNGAARKVERDPSVLLRGARPAAPGPGESP